MGSVLLFKLGDNNWASYVAYASKSEDYRKICLMFMPLPGFERDEGSKYGDDISKEYKSVDVHDSISKFPVFVGFYHLFIICSWNSDENELQKNI